MHFLYDFSQDVYWESVFSTGSSTQILLGIPAWQPYSTKDMKPSSHHVAFFQHSVSPYRTEIEEAVCWPRTAAPGSKQHGSGASKSTVRDPTKFKQLLTDSARIPVPCQELHARAQDNCLRARSVASHRKQTFPATKLSTGAGKTSHGNRAPYSGLGHSSSRVRHSSQLEAC